MPKHVISTDRLPPPTSPISLGVRANGFLFTSGQVGKDAHGRIVEGFGPQVRQAMENVKTIVEASGASMDDVVKVTIFVTDISRMSEMNEVYRSFFSGSLPARSTVQVSQLGLKAEVEIEALVVLP